MHKGVMYFTMSTLTKVFPRVLSIQSTVSHGYVGNKCATFPLQCLGFHVDAINTVSLSNHPDYPGGFKGQFLSADDMAATVAGLQGNDMLSRADCILTGYTRSPQVLSTIEATVQQVRAANPNVLYCCDPVLGDNGSFYVPEELLDMYKTRLIPLAYAVTPNYFETEKLTGIQVRSMGDAKRACAVFHSWGVTVCVLKGLRLGNDPDSGPLSVVLSMQEEGQACILRRDVPRVAGRYSGCGDLFSALVVAGLYRARAALARTESAAPAAAAARHATLSYVLGTVLDDVTTTMSTVVGETSRAGGRELQIIESVDLYRDLQAAWSRLPASPSTAAGPEAWGALREPGAAGEGRNARRAHVQKGHVSGVLFDMDGTLTMPGAIDFSKMYSRNGLEKSGGDILTQIYAIADADKRRIAMAVVEEEEELGCGRMTLRPDMRSLLLALHRSRIRVALSTRNCMPALAHFLQLADVSRSFFHPALTRDCLDGVNKPDPQVARHVLSAWEVEEHEAASVWFVGDSEDDMVCGHGAGLRTCLLRTDYNRAFAKARPECVSMEVDSLAEFAERALGVDVESLGADA